VIKGLKDALLYLRLSSGAKSEFVMRDKPIMSVC